MTEQTLIAYLESIIAAMKRGEVVEGNIEFHPNPDVEGHVYRVDSVIRYLDGVSIVEDRRAQTAALPERTGM